MEFFEFFLNEGSDNETQITMLIKTLAIYEFIMKWILRVFDNFPKVDFVNWIGLFLFFDVYLCQNGFDIISKHWVDINWVISIANHY